MSRRPATRLTRTLIVLSVAGALALTGCAPDDEPETQGADPADAGAGGSGEGRAAGGAAASCVAAVSYEDTLYLRVDAGEVSPGAALEGAELPPCDDTGGGEESEAEAMPVEAFAVEGVDPRYAVLSEGPDGLWVYVARSHAPGLADAAPLPADVAAALGLD